MYPSTDSPIGRVRSFLGNIQDFPSKTSKVENSFTRFFFALLKNSSLTFLYFFLFLSQTSPAPAIFPFRFHPFLIYIVCISAYLFPFL